MEHPKHTAKSFFISLQRLQRCCPTVESFEIFVIQSKSSVAVLDNLLMLRGVEVDIACSTIGEEDRFRLRCDSNSASVVVDCYLELALLVGRVALGLEAGRYFCALLRRESSPRQLGRMV